MADKIDDADLFAMGELIVNGATRDEVLELLESQIDLLEEQLDAVDVQIEEDAKDSEDIIIIDDWE